jgi:tetratricopeptide (TPR) repeat protein
MQDSGIAFLIGLMAGSIFFIDGWGPSEKEKTGFAESRRFRGLSVLVVGGIITPVLDYVTKNAKPEYFLAYLKGCILGWFFVLLFGLVLYLFWIVSKQSKKDNIFYKLGEFAYAILDFIYLGISDNPHLTAKRTSDVDLAKGVYQRQSDFELKKLESELADATFKPAGKRSEKKIADADLKQAGKGAGFDEKTKSKIKLLNKETTNSKTEAEYTFNDWYYKAIAEYDKKEFEKCIAYMKNALELDAKADNAPDAYLYMGLCFDYLALYQKSGLQYDKIISDYPGYTSMHLAHSNKGVIFDKQLLFEESIIEYDKAINIKPNFEDAWYNKGISLTKLKRYPEAIKVHEEALKLKPDDYEAMLYLGDNFAELGQYKDAIKYYEDLIKIKPDYEYAWYGKARSLHQLRKYADALAAYDKALSLSPKYANALIGKSVSLQKMGQLDDSLTALEEAIKLNPPEATAWFNAAAGYTLKNEKDKALQNLKKAIEIDSTCKADAKTDGDFKPLWNDADFIKLVA